MATSVASLYAEISLRDSLSAGLKRASGNLQGFGAQLGSIGGVGIQVFGGIATALAGMSGGLRRGISAASDFQSTMREIEARTGATAEEMEKIRATAMKMGADTVFSGQQAGDALLQLMTTGQSAAEAIETLPSVLSLAAAGGLELARSADGVTDVMAAFGLVGKKGAEEVANSLARAAGTSSATVSDLLQGFANVGPLARQYGMSVEETAATLAIFSENGIKGAEAGTQLKSMLTNLSSKTARREMERLGVSMFDAQGKARPLNNVIQDLAKKINAMSDSARVETLKTLGGSYGQIGLAALISGMSIEEMAEKMRAAASASDVAAARMDTFKGATNSLMGSIETLAIKALTPFMEKVLTPLVKEMTNVVNKVGEFADDVQSMGLQAAVEKWFGAAMKWLEDNAPSLFENALRIAFTWRGELVKWITDNAPKLIDGINAWFKSAWKWVEDNGAALIRGAIDSAFKGLGDIVTMITTVAPSLINAVTTWFGAGFSFIEQHGGKLISYAIQSAFSFLKDSVAAIAEIAPDIWKGIQAWFGSAWDALKKAAPEIIETAFREGFRLIRDFGAWLIQNAPNILQGITDWFKSAFDWLIKEGAPFVANVVKGVFNGIGEGLGLGKLGDGIQQAFTDLLGEGSAVRGVFEGFKNFVSGIFDAIGAIMRVPIQIIQNLLGTKPNTGDLAGDAAQIGRGTQGLAEMRQAPISLEPLMTDDTNTGRPIWDASLAVESMQKAKREVADLAQKTAEMLGVGSVADRSVEGLKQKFADLVNAAAPNMTTFLQTTVPALFTVAFGEDSVATKSAAAMLGEGGLLSSLLNSAGKDMDAFGAKAAGIGDAIGTGMQPVAGKMVSPVADGVKRIGKLLESIGKKSGFFSELGTLGAILFAEGNRLIEGRAAGGPVMANTPYLVGERGPELFVPSASGTIAPNHALGGMTVHIGSLVLNGVNDPKALYDAIAQEGRKRNRGNA